MKRKICMILCACFFMSCMLVPASASEYSGYSFIQVLDFGGINGTAGHSRSYIGDSFYFNLPYSMPIGYIDIIVTLTGVQATSCTVSLPSGAASVLSLVNIGDNLYRIYGFANFALASQVFFDLERSGTGSTVVTFHSFKISSTHFLGYQEIACFAVNGSSFQYMPGPGQSVSYSWSGNADKEHYTDFVGYIYLQNWKKYDYLDVSFLFDCNSVTAISANLDGVMIPMEISYFDVGSNNWYTTEVGESTSLFHDIPRNATVYARLDLSGVNRSSSSLIQITFSGTYSTYVYDTSSFKLLDYWGFVELEDWDPVPYWFSQLNSKLATLISSLSTLSGNLNTWITSQTSALQTEFTNLKSAMALHFNNLNSWITAQTAALQTEFSNLKTAIGFYFDKLDGWITDQNAALQTEFTNLKSAIAYHFTNLNSWIQAQTNKLEAAIRGDTAAGDAFQDEVDEKDQQLDDMAAVMDSVNKPALDSINVDVSGYVSPTDVSALAAPLLVFITGDVFGPIIIMSILFATVSYVLYGKRG